MDSLIR